MIVGAARRRGRPARRVRRRRGAPARADARPLAVPQARRSTARRSPPSRCRRRCSRCSCTSRSTSRTRWATRRWRPACASCRSRCSRSSWRRCRASSPSGSASAGSSRGGLALVGLGLLLMRGIEPGRRLDRAAGRLHGRRRAASASSTRRSPPRRSAWWSRSAPAWPPGINSTFRQVGIATGTAALGAIFAHVVNGRREVFAAAARAPG